VVEAVGSRVAVDVLTDPDGTPHVGLDVHREHGIAYLSLFGSRRRVTGTVTCGCGELFEVAAVRPAPLMYAASPSWDDEVDGNAPTRPGRVTEC
jgi:hypothetical protein